MTARKFVPKDLNLLDWVKFHETIFVTFESFNTFNHKYKTILDLYSPNMI